MLGNRAGTAGAPIAARPLVPPVWNEAWQGADRRRSHLPPAQEEHGDVVQRGTRASPGAARPGHAAWKGQAGRSLADLSFSQRVYPAAKLEIVTQALGALGIAPGAGLRGTPFTLDDLMAPDTLICLDDLATVYRNAMRVSDDPHLPFKIGSMVHVSTYGIYGYAMLCSTDCRAMAEFAVRYQRLATPLAALSFLEEKGLSYWMIDPLPQAKLDDRLYRFITELYVATIISLSRDVMGDDFAPDSVALSYGEHSDFSLNSDLLSLPVHHDQPRNHVCFNSRWLGRRPRLANPITQLRVERLCDGLLSDLISRTGLAGRLRCMLAEGDEDKPTLAGAARRLGMTTRTLRRQLRMQDTSFRTLLDELRVQKAIRYIRETQMTTEDIGFALGYSDAANFRHAFRRWTGQTPTAFRNAPPTSTIDTHRRQTKRI